MSASARRIALFALAGVILLSGWAVALGLGVRLREVSRHRVTLAEVPHHAAAAPVEVAEPRAPEEIRAPIDPGDKVLVEGSVERAFREFAAQPEAAGAAVAFCLLDENGATIFASPLAEVALCPASSLKTVTTGAAFGVLGPEFRFETVLAATAPVGKEGLLEGDLLLIGAGDPTLSEEDLAALATEAVAAGLKRVNGRILVDTAVFPANPVSDHWVWGDIGNAYGAGAFGLNLNHNRLRLKFQRVAEPGKPAPLLGKPAVPRETRWINTVTTGPADSGDEVVVYSEPFGRVITLRGTVPAGEGAFPVSGALPDPPALAAELLRARLEEGGVKFAERSRTAKLPEGDRTTLARHWSASLPEIIDHLHRVSDNLEAQCLFLSIGKKLENDPAAAIRAHWENAGVAFTGLRLLDGSGLARANMIRALDLARVNSAARRGPHGQRYQQSLSAYLGGNVRAKIGAMSGVKTQVGFLRTAKGRELTFAVMGNGLAPGGDFWQQVEKLQEAVRTAEDLGK